MKLLEISYEWLTEMDELDGYELSVVSGTRVKIIDAISNLEGLL